MSWKFILNKYEIGDLVEIEIADNDSFMLHSSVSSHVYSEKVVITHIDLPHSSANPTQEVVYSGRYLFCGSPVTISFTESKIICKINTKGTI